MGQTLWVLDECATAEDVQCMLCGDKCFTDRSLPIMSDAYEEVASPTAEYTNAKVPQLFMSTRSCPGNGSSV